MKLAGREAERFCASPDRPVTGILIHGSDQGMVHESRRLLVLASMGGAIDDLRLTQLESAEIRKDPASLYTALRSRGFFPGRQVVVVSGATDGMTKAVENALKDTTTDDALLVMTSASLPARSSLRKLFEGKPDALSLHLFSDTIDLQDLQEMLRRAGLSEPVSQDALMAIAEVAADLDRGSLARFVELVGLFALSLQSPLTPEDVDRLSPLGRDAEIDTFVQAVADGQTRALAPLIRRLVASGSSPVALILALQRHFRMLFQAASAPGGPGSGLAAIKPPLWGPRRDAVASQLRLWSQPRLETALSTLFETDGRIRSSSNVPDIALIERCAMRLSLLARR